MKKLLILGLTCILLSLSPMAQAYSQEKQTENKTPEITFTEEQKSELSKLHQKILTDKKELLNKYVEYGALKQEQADKIIEHLEKRYEMIEERGFQYPPHHMHHKPHHH